MVPKILTQERLKELLDYDPDTGIFVWRTIRTGKAFAGSTAGTVDVRGYNRIFVCGRKYYAHRLAYLYIYGYMPEEDVDHIDRDKLNNMIYNLREITPKCNMRNSNISIRNTSGIKGVCWHKKNSKWIASVRVDRKLIYLGSFGDKCDAAIARFRAEVAYNFTNCEATSTAYLYIKENDRLGELND